MPRATFSGVKLSLVGDVNVEIKYADVNDLRKFMEMKELLDEYVQPRFEGTESVPKAK